jgi:3D-(3,5/4)-trihydroxycyclohexane-1,2-dione acylhydrolase (decyclizing)
VESDGKLKSDWSATGCSQGRTEGRQCSADRRTSDRCGAADLLEAATVIMGAAGTMPGELHKIWDAAQGGYHMEYGFSCMGYEVAGAMGIKMARPRPM